MTTLFDQNKDNKKQSWQYIKQSNPLLHNAVQRINGSKYYFNQHSARPSNYYKYCNVINKFESTTENTSPWDNGDVIEVQLDKNQKQTLVSEQILQFTVKNTDAVNAITLQEGACLFDQILLTSSESQQIGSVIKKEILLEYNIFKWSASHTKTGEKYMGLQSALNHGVNEWDLDNTIPASGEKRFYIMIPDVFRGQFVDYHKMNKETNLRFEITFAKQPSVGVFPGNWSDIKLSGCRLIQLCRQVPLYQYMALKDENGGVADYRCSDIQLFTKKVSTLPVGETTLDFNFSNSLVSNVLVYIQKQAMTVSNLKDRVPFKSCKLVVDGLGFNWQGQQNSVIDQQFTEYVEGYRQRRPGMMTTDHLAPNHTYLISFSEISDALNNTGVHHTAVNLGQNTQLVIENETLQTDVVVKLLVFRNCIVRQLTNDSPTPIIFSA